MSHEIRDVIGVVDDDPRILESLEDLLESAGYGVRCYSSGRALLASDIASIDCLITDVCMPGMDGFELRDRMKQVRPELPVFLISARTDLRSDRRVESEVEFFPKPFDGPTLLAAIGEALRRTDG